MVTSYEEEAAPTWRLPTVSYRCPRESGLKGTRASGEGANLIGYHSLAKLNTIKSYSVRSYE